jgi:hypothetical protein
MKVLDRLKKDPEMTYSDAQEELQQAFPGILKREPPTPRRLLTDMTNLEAEIEDFDITSLDKATHRAKAKRTDLLAAAKSLSATLQGIVTQLAEAR